MRANLWLRILKKSFFWPCCLWCKGDSPMWCQVGNMSLWRNSKIVYWALSCHQSQNSITSFATLVNFQFAKSVHLSFISIMTWITLAKMAHVFMMPINLRKDPNQLFKEIEEVIRDQTFLVVQQDQEDRRIFLPWTLTLELMKKWTTMNISGSDSWWSIGCKNKGKDREICRLGKG